MPPKKKGKKGSRTPPSVVLDPTWVEVKSIRGKGKGLVAAQEIPANARLQYDGVTINEAEYNRLCTLSHNDTNNVGYVNYVMATGKAGQYIDAHPRHAGSENWIGGRVNEPAPKQTANMVIKLQNKLPILITTRKINAGDELMVKYTRQGDHYVRPYKAGRQARLPKWLDSSKS